MRERAVAAGGSLRCGAAVGGGFLIEATLPGKVVAAGAAGGHGRPGMRERAASAGGELRTGVAPGGGLLIGATLPAEEAG